jgi:hypothetical protein
MIADRGLLESLRATALTPGTNLRGGALGAAWTYLLPNQRIGRLVCVGEPSQAALARLMVIAEQVDLLPGRRAARRWALTAEAEGWAGLRVLADAQGLHQQYDLAWATRGARHDWIEVAYRAARLRYRERRSIRLRGSKGAPSAAPAGGDALVVRLGPWLGEVRLAVPVADRVVADYVRERRLEEAGLRDALAARGVPRAGAVARILHLGDEPTRRFVRTGRLAGLPGPDPLLLPAYLRTLDPETFGSYGWALSASGAYRTKKVLFHLFASGHRSPELIVKLVSHAADAPLLEQAYQGLTAARERGITALGRAPEPIMLARPDGVTALVERMIDGRPFETQSRGTADCPVALDALEGLIEIGERTRRSAAPGAVAAELGAIVERFIDLYRPAGHVRAVLGDAVALIGQSPEPFPIVGMHGDAGRQNLLVDRDGRVVFLDWERWEPAGLPLWDIAHFIRSYVTWATRRSRPMSRLAALKMQFVDGGPLTPFVARALEDGARRLGVEPRLVAPLVLTSFAAEAVREAERLEPQRRASGSFVRALELLCSSLDAPVTRRLLGIGATDGTVP